MADNFSPTAIDLAILRTLASHADKWLAAESDIWEAVKGSGCTANEFALRIERLEHEKLIERHPTKMQTLERPGRDANIEQFRWTYIGEDREYRASACRGTESSNGELYCCWYELHLWHILQAGQWMLQELNVRSTAAAGPTLEHLEQPKIKLPTNPDVAEVWNAIQAAESEAVNVAGICRFIAEKRGCDANSLRTSFNRWKRRNIG